MQPSAQDPGAAGADAPAGKDNPGVILLGQASPAEPPARAQVLVSGAARGGTSLVASLLARMGLPMGHRPPKFENPALRACVEARDWDHARRIAAALDARHPHWGFKLAGLHQHFASLVPLLSHPRVVLVYRDPFACAVRKNALKPGADILALIDRNLDEYRRMGQAARALDCPVLLVSQEKAATGMDAVARALARFAGLPEPGDDLQAQVLADRSRYLQSTRADFRQLAGSELLA